MERHLKTGYLYWNLRRSVKAELIKSKYSLENIRNLVPQVLKQKRLDIKLQNQIFGLHKEAEMNQSFERQSTAETNRETDQNPNSLIPKKQPDLDFLERMRKSWSFFLQKQILSISKQLKEPLVKTIKAGGNSTVLNLKKGVVEVNGGKNASDSESEADLPKYTGVFGPSKFFENMLRTHNPNHERCVNQQIVGWGLIKLELKTPSLETLQMWFEELAPKHFNLGSGTDVFFGQNNGMKDPNEGYSLHCQRVVNGRAEDVLKICRSGCVADLRADAWKTVLGVPKSNSTTSQKYFQALVSSTREVKLLVDEMIVNDVKKTCDDERFFIFEETLIHVLTAFSRDSWVYANSEVKPYPIFGALSGGPSAKKKKIKTNFPYPPNGVVPFEGMSMLCAPLCYFLDPCDTFLVFRALYVKVFCKLHVISSREQTLLRVCKLFENLLLDLHPQLFYHLLELNIHPLDIAIHWLFHAFSGYLDMQELLLLWDRIIGFDNLYIMAVLAAGIFLVRAKFILKCDDQQKIFDVFGDFSAIKAIPIIQMVLFLNK